MFRQFLPSEFDAHGISYSRQLKDALIINSWQGPRGLQQLLDDHFQRWLNCDIKDVRIALRILKHSTQTAQIRSATNSAERVVQIYSYRKRWLRLCKTEIKHIEANETRYLDAMDAFKTHEMRPETLFLAYRLYNVFSRICVNSAINMSISLAFPMEQGDYSQVPVTNKECYLDFLKTKQVILLSRPTIYTFLDILMHVVDVSEPLVLYFAELSIVSKAAVSFLPSEIVAACVFLARASLELEDFWPYVLENFTRISYLQVSYIASVIFQKARQVMRKPAFREKYNNSVGRTVLGFGIRHFQNIIIQPTGAEPFILNTFPVSTIEITRDLSSGAFGTVFLAKYNGNDCVIKMTNELKFTTFNREISFLLAVKSKHVIPVIDYIFEQNIANKRNQLCIVLEKGEDFYTQLNQASRILKNQWCIQLIQAVKHCHECGIMHRDIKPENIVIVSRQLKLCDFGMARRVYLAPRSYTIPVTTMVWRAPEVLLGKRNYNEKIDVWSTGIVMCQCIQSQSIYKFDGIKTYNMSNSKARRSSWGQIVKLWQLFGTPSEETWPGFSELPGFNEHFPSYPGNLHTFFNDNLSQATRLQKKCIRGMLQVDPSSRLSMHDALRIILEK